VDGLILPDLPEYEFENEYGAIIRRHGLDFIFLVTPETSPERVKKLDSLSSTYQAQGVQTDIDSSLALQGLSAGVGLIVGRAVVRDCLHGDDAQRLMSHISMIFGIAPAIAPVIGGVVLGWSNWHGIFWFLALFGVVLLALTAWGLPETHPPQNRVRLHPVGLARSYGAMLASRKFRLLALVGTFNFGALFLYIASAPAFVIDLLGLGEQDFVWFFAPTIAGMMLGAFVSGRSAGRVSGQRLVAWGFGFCGAAAVYNIAYNARCGTRSHLYPQVRETLVTLREQGVKLAVVTNKEGRSTQVVLT
jgi:hypothetical protein